ncbi:hypothetical protein DMENIID0001_127090 [Sergentomyia squamirostris]
MSIICEDIPHSDLVAKGAYHGVDKFVWVKRTERPKDIKVAEKWCMEPLFMPIFYKEIAQRIEDFEVRSDDVWVVTYAKCGTTWTQEMVWLLMNDCDYKAAEETKLQVRFPFIEFGSILSRDLKFGDEIARSEAMPSPRTIKTHLSAPCLPRKIWSAKPKIIYVARNAKDTAVSFYHHSVNLHHYTGTFDDFMETFLKDHVIYTPFHSHIIDFWRMRNEENILFLTYEDMKRDHPSVIRKTAKFLGKSISDEAVQKLADYLSFSNFSKNTAVNMDKILKNIEEVFDHKMPDQKYNFVRRGVAGGFRDEMSPEWIDKFNRWTKEECKKWKCDDELKNIFLFSDKQ